jgi:hypothetical protein
MVQDWTHPKIIDGLLIFSNVNLWPSQYRVSSGFICLDRCWFWVVLKIRDWWILMAGCSRHSQTPSGSGNWLLLLQVQSFCSDTLRSLLTSGLSNVEINGFTALFVQIPSQIVKLMFSMLVTFLMACRIVLTFLIVFVRITLVFHSFLVFSVW